MNVLSKLCLGLFWGHYKRREKQIVSGKNKEKEETVKRKKERKKEAVTKESGIVRTGVGKAILPTGWEVLFAIDMGEVMSKNQFMQ